jgi:hypothetical protein
LNKIYEEGQKKLEKELSIEKLIYSVRQINDIISKDSEKNEFLYKKQTVIDLMEYEDDQSQLTESKR